MEDKKTSIIKKTHCMWHPDCLFSCVYHLLHPTTKEAETEQEACFTWQWNLCPTNNKTLYFTDKKSPLSIAGTAADEHRENAKSIPHKTSVTDWNYATKWNLDKIHKITIFQLFQPLCTLGAQSWFKHTVLKLG